VIHFNWVSPDVSDALHQVTARGAQKIFQGVSHYVCVGLLDVLLWFLGVHEAVGSRLHSN